MITLIKNIVIARKVCRKYGLKYSVFDHYDGGSYHYLDKCISVNPFSKNFMSILMHEVGHHVHDKRAYYLSFLSVDRPENDNGTMRNKEDKDWYKVLYAEAYASRFAAKTKKADREYLVQCFNTYTKQGFSWKRLGSTYHFSRYVDWVHKCTRMIQT